MNASVRESGYDGPSKDEPLQYAPKKARHSETGKKAADAPPPPPGEGPPPLRPSKEQHPSTEQPPWRRSRQRSSGAAFAGDIAVAELRTKLALAPDRLPEPPPQSSHGSTLVWAGRITGVAVVAAVGIIGYQWGSSSPSRTPMPLPSQGRSSATPDRSVAAVPDGSLPVKNTVLAVYPPPGAANPPPAKTFSQLTIGNAPPRQTDEPAPLAISAADAGTNAVVVLGGLAPGSALSTGREIAPRTWRLAVEDLPSVSVTPPRGFAGVMDLSAELRLADGTVADRKSFQLEWLIRSVAKAQPRQHDAAEIAQIMSKGADLMANGDVAAARLMYQRAAEAGESVAAFALAETYDPLVLAKGGIAPDVGMAQAWYIKARDLGSTQAVERLERLGRVANQ